MKLAVAVIVVLVALSAAARPKWHQLAGYNYDAYVADFHKSHVKGSTEYALREKIFMERLTEIQAFNKLESATYKKGINHMSDWTDAERKALNGRLPDSVVGTVAPSMVYTAPKNVQLPMSIDYSQAVPAVLTAVKDQGQCGSCWAHAATESIETALALATGDLFVLSQQQITSCTPNPHMCGGTGGCMGATAELAWEYVKNTTIGITQEWMYPYTSYFGESGVCSWNATIQTPYAKVTGHSTVARNDDAATAAALVNLGPHAISVDASHWYEYESGVYTGCNYSNNISMDHAVQLVGYGHDDVLNVDYWKVRNSWSADFGEEGFIRLIRDTECGLNVDWNTMGGGCPNKTPNTMQACGQCGILYDVVAPMVTMA